MAPGAITAVDAPQVERISCVMLDLKLLTTFREVAVRRSFSDAAAALDFTQPAVSQHIGRLERILDVRLLERGARGVGLTPAGEVLLRHAAALLDAGRVPRRRSAPRPAWAHGDPGRRLPVGGRRAAARGHARAARAPPDAELELQVLEEGPALDALLAGRLDVATIVVSPLSPSAPRPGAEYLHVCDDELRVAVAADHPLATAASLALEELARSRSCSRRSPGRARTRTSCCTPSAPRATSRRALLLRRLPGAAGDGRVGIGVALIPTMALTSSRSDVVVLPLRGRPPARQVLAVVREGERDALVDHFVEALRTSARALAGGHGLAAAA
jgi:DNA-binding transcriptional LysR family regulator